MSTEIDAYEAKTHLPALLERVARGERITITKHGRPIALLVPIQRSAPKRRREAIERLKVFADGHTLDVPDKQLITRAGGDGSRNRRIRRPSLGASGISGLRPPPSCWSGFRPHERRHRSDQRLPAGARPLAEELASGERIGIPTVALFELIYGYEKSAQRERNEAALRSLLTLDIEPLPFELADAEHAGAIRAQLERAGTPIGHYDLLIAAQARRHGATLVTANQREFARVPGLDVVDWATP